ncbi:DUF5677 domain-containing protein [Marinicrinis sediminis]|uniref:DUF5677 domain-containing protein n=1 Tax=Marinicrinis sediminis TaxID=1652465 RepID=A0ABW5R8V9_9BACL
MDPVQKTLLEYAARSSHILHEYFQLISGYFNKESEIPIVERYVLKQLPISCHLTSESILILVGNLRVWDNEMLLRSLLEGTLKFTYLTIGTHQERKKKIEEFWEILPKINEVRRSKRATQLLQHAQDDELKLIRGVVIDDEEIAKIEEMYPRKYRKQVEQKWSYSEIVKELSKYKHLEFLNGFFHGYGIGSHLIHQDADAINFLIDHNSRIDERRRAKELAHGCRQISDIMTYCVLRYGAYKLLHNESTEDIYLESHIQLNKEMETFHKSFEQTEQKYLDY